MQNDVAEMLDESLALADRLETIARLEMLARSYQDEADHLKGDVRARLVKMGRKSLVVGRMKAELRPNETLHCRCHNEQTKICANALAGRDIAVRIVQLDPYLSIKPTRPFTLEAA